MAHKGKVIVTKGILQWIPVDKILPPEPRVRTYISEEGIKELTRSIRHHGLIQPITVVQARKKYRIVAGERRYLACKLAKLKKIPAFVLSMKDDERILTSLAENIQREEMDAISEALALATLREKYKWDDETMAHYIGKSRPYVINRLRLLLLPSQVRTLVLQRKLPDSHALELLSLLRDEVAEELAKKEGISIEEAMQKLQAKCIDIAQATARSNLTRDQVRVMVRSNIHMIMAKPVVKEEEVEAKPLTVECVGCRAKVVVDVSKSIIVCADCYERLTSAFGKSA